MRRLRWGRGSSPPPSPDQAGFRGWPEEPADWADQTPGSRAIVALLDQPAPGAVVRADEPLFVAGWAVPAAGPVGRVDVLANGRLVGYARLGYPRPDVAERYGLPHARLSGFDLRADPDPLLREAATLHLEVVAHGLNGQRWVIADATWPVARPGPDDASVPVPAQPTSRTGRPFSLLVVTHDLSYSGSSLWLAELLEQAGAGRDFPCTVASARPGPLAGRLRDLGIRVRVRKEVPLADDTAFEAGLAELATWIASERYTAVLANTFFTFPLVEAARRAGLPSVWVIHESWSPTMIWPEVYGPEAVHPWARRVAAAALRGCGELVFVAEATRALFRGTRKGVVVRSGIRTARVRDYCAAVDRAAARRELGVPEGRRLLLAVGTVEPRKGQSLLALAMSRLCERHPDVRLALVGGTGSLFETGLCDYLAEAGLADRVRVLSTVADVSPWYRAADALVCASDIESLPLSVLEGMAFGLPVVSTSAFGLAELLTDGHTGLLCPPRDLGALIEALERLLTLEPPELHRMAEAGRALVLRDYDAAGSANYPAEILALLRRLAA